MAGIRKQEFVEKYLGMFPVPAYVPYEKESFTDEKKNYIAYSMEKAEIKPGEPIAYVTREGSSSASYHVFLPKSGKAAMKAFALHEFGHIIFQHLRFEELRKKQVISHIEANWNKFKPLIDFEGDDTAKQELETRSALVHQISNVAMDMEVNSRQFPNGDERTRAFAAMENFVLRNAIENVNTKEDAKKITDWVKENKADPNKHFATFVDPRDYGFPDGLDFMAYVELILQQPENFMNQQQNALDGDANNQPQEGDGQGQAQGQGQGNGQGQGGSNDQGGDQNGQGQGDGQNNGNGNGNANGQNSKGKGSSGKKGKGVGGGARGKMKASDLKKIAQETDTKHVLDQASKGSVGNSSSSGNNDNTGIGDDDGYAYVRGKGDTVRGIQDFIKKICVMEDKVGYRQDVLYNYNRGKHSGGVMIPKSMQHHAMRYGNIYALIDVSGSVSESAVVRIIKNLKESKGVLGPKSKVIFWNTHYAGEYNLNSREEIKVPVGGGTSLGAGIYYINEKYIKRPEDKLFIVSDFEDYMEEWNTALGEVKCETYALEWDSEDKGEYNEFRDKTSNVRRYGYDNNASYKNLEKMRIAHFQM